MIRAVIFDIDGTLMDTNYLHVEAFARAFREVGHEIPRAAIHEQIGKGSDQLLPTLLGDDVKAVERADSRHSEIYAELEEQGYPLPGAKELLAALKERRIASWLATSAKPEQLKFLLGALEAEGKIAGVVSSGDVEASKPEPDVFAAALERAGCPSDEAVVVGDTVWDVIAAKKAGLRTVAVLTGGAFSRAELEESGAVRVCQDCAELLSTGFPDDL